MFLEIPDFTPSYAIDAGSAVFGLLIKFTLIRSAHIFNCSTAAALYVSAATNEQDL